jgi:ABC-type multidrug transport system fused ATPase/permease subunit
VPTSLNGEIKFEHVKFCYPTRTLDPVLRDLSVTFEAKKTTAIVGHSGYVCAFVSIACLLLAS